jgi:tryptophan synthase alpha chain
MPDAQAPAVDGSSSPARRRIEAAFGESRGRAALMPYLMGGFPSLEASLEVGRVYARHADLVEVGVPFSDPLADGPAIQAAGQRALAAGATLERVLDEVAAPLASTLPVVVMCYANPIFARGFEAVVDALSGHGVAGLIVPDMPAIEATELRAVCDERGIALVPLVAPTTGDAALERIGAQARGFTYVVSVTGVTGERKDLPPELPAVVERVRAASSVPVAVGFGVGTPAQAAAVGEIADGVIIGSRLVREIAEAPSLEEGLAGADAFLEASASALAGE